MSFIVESIDRWHGRLGLGGWMLCGTILLGQDPREIPPSALREFVDHHCIECHDAGAAKGELDLESIGFDFENTTNVNLWVRIHDRVEKREMPPRETTALPSDHDRQVFLKELATRLIAVDDERTLRSGRSTWRRMNRYEYENTLRDLLGAPWLQIKVMLPEDGEAYRFNKVGDALDVSHVQIARYLAAAEYAIREAIAAQAMPEPTITRHYARDQPAFARRIQFSQFNKSPERATFPIIGNEADVPALEGKAPITVGAEDPERRELESMGVVASTYEPIEIKFDAFKAPASGRYHVRICAHSFWAGPESDEKWWKPSRTEISKGRTREPVSIYSETPPRLLRKLGSFDVTPEPSVQSLDVYLLKGETIRPDAVRLFRSRPPGGWHNPLAEKDGQPGVTFRWLEVEGPFPESTLIESRNLLFGNLPMVAQPDGIAQVQSENTEKDASRLLENFMMRANGRNPAREDVLRFLDVIRSALDSGSPFAEAMVTGYSAVLCSPEFVTLEELPGSLDDSALAARLSYFLWNSEADQELRRLAVAGRLKNPEVLRAQTKRMLDDPKASRFIEAFLDYWLDLRKANATSPDAEIYPDYYLDDFLVESACDETRAFFSELIAQDLPARNIVASDFGMINERLSQHYGLPDVKGVELRRVSIPEDSPRGGILTQASILKITANGTTTSPVLRGVWIMERILGEQIPPPPSAVPAVEPDTRGATTIRQQLDKHRTLDTCNVCHQKIDPTGFALENFDVVGGWRDHYRAFTQDTHTTMRGYGKNGQPITHRTGPAIDASGTLPGGDPFQDIRELKQLLLSDERQIARNLAKHLIVYATGGPVRFGDRPELESLLDLAEPSNYGVKSLIVEIVQSELFRHK